MPTRSHWLCRLIGHHFFPTLDSYMGNCLACRRCGGMVASKK